MLRALLVLLAVLGGGQPSAAQLGGQPVDKWIKTLEAPTRVAGLKIDQILTSLALQPGQIVADLGAGTGLFSLPMARAVGPSGKVFAVEIEQGFLDYINQKAKDQNVPNVVTVLGKAGDPALPTRDVDLAFLHDVLHHIADRPAYLKQVTHYLKSAGRIAVVDLNPANSPHRDDPTLQVTRDKVDTWMGEAGFVPAQVFALFEEKWFVVYARK